MLIFSLHAFSVFFMTGVIWIIQIIHYPQMSLVSPENFLEYHQKHSALITPIVGPTMILQLVTAGLLMTQPNYENTFKILAVAGSILVFGFTFFLSVPIHNQLGNGYSADLIHQLTITNWPRTLTWTAHSVLILLCMNGRFQAAP